MQLDWDMLLNSLGWYIEKGKGWIPTCGRSTPRIEQKSSGESTPRIEKKCSGGDDGPKERLPRMYVSPREPLGCFPNRCVLR